MGNPTSGMDVCRIWVCTRYRRGLGQGYKEMNITISSVAGKGDLASERIILKVLSDTDIGRFALMQTGYNGTDVTLSVHHTMWFPYQPVLSGELIVIYTKVGTKTTSAMKSGQNAHFFYWGLGSPIWNRTDRAPVLLYAPEWEKKAPSQL
jgi:hypothetical protein